LVSYWRMEKIAANKPISRSEGIKIATMGFATLAGSPATSLSPQEVHTLAGSYSKRATSRIQRHDNIRESIKSHVKG